MTLKKKLKNQELTIGSWLTIGHQSIVEIMLSNDFDWLTIDIEHTAIDFGTLMGLIGTIQGKGKKALVRVGAIDELIIKRCMDLGADGIVAPMVKCKADAEEVVGFVKYPPEGKRGVGLSRAQQYGEGFNEYKEWLNSEVVIIAQIEHIDAVDNIEEILSVKGIDGIIVGPYDLSGSMGYPGEFERQEVKDALQKVIDACKRSKISLGYHVIDPSADKVNEKISEGYNFIAFSTDFLFLGNKCKNEFNQLSREH